ncbi:MAG TPA: HTTM domain-containing protein [Aeromicrobium sp.]|nr:HTTM domain-containing protein [Aeromicrobium sp.]
MLNRLVTKARTPVDSASLAVFRMMFGAIGAWEVTRYFNHGWISRYWEEPDFHFHYVGFGWVEPLPPPWMHVLWAVLGIAAVAIAIGAFYRIATVVFAICFGYSFLLETAMYLNHFYLLALLAILMVFVPAHRVWSVDAWRAGWSHDQPSPAWALWALRFQVGVLYVGGGIAKIESDWLQGQPMSMWLAHRTHFPLIGRFFDHPSAGLIAAWSGTLFDLLIVFAVAWRRTRLLAFVAAVLFHFTNSQLFSIGIFPFLALGSLTLFCPPDWPRALVRILEGRRWTPRTFEAPPALAGRAKKVAIGGVALGLIFAATQILIPLRHYAMPGRSTWTEAGHTFSWHMKQRDKEGDVTFIVDRPGETATVFMPAMHLPEWQYTAMKTRPELIRQYAHEVADLAVEREPSKPRPSVHVIALVSLNGRKPQLMIDDDVDLASEPATLGTPSWVVPLRDPLPPRDEVWEP